eukprot:3149548-Amphidinium_carterae.2
MAHISTLQLQHGGVDGRNFAGQIRARYCVQLLGGSDGHLYLVMLAERDPAATRPHSWLESRVWDLLLLTFSSLLSQTTRYASLASQLWDLHYQRGLQNGQPLSQFCVVGRCIVFMSVFCIFVSTPMVLSAQ